MTPADVIRKRAKLLVAQAEREGVVLTVEQRPLQPLAMGHHHTVVSVRQARHGPVGQQPQAEAVPSDDLHKFLDAAAGEGLVLDGVDAADLYKKVFLGQQKQPQAEAVPSDVVRDAERYRWLFSGHTEDELNADALAGRQPTMTTQDQFIADFSAWYTLKKTADAKIDAARAQGEKP